MSAFRPHVTICTSGAVHVMPVAMVRDVAAGRLPLSAIGDDCLRVIVGEWMTRVEEDDARG